MSSPFERPLFLFLIATMQFANRKLTPKNAWSRSENLVSWKRQDHPTEGRACVQ